MKFCCPLLNLRLAISPASKVKSAYCLKPVAPECLIASILKVPCSCPSNPVIVEAITFTGMLIDSALAAKTEAVIFFTELILFIHLSKHYS